MPQRKWGTPAAGRWRYINAAERGKPGRQSVVALATATLCPAHGDSYIALDEVASYLHVPLGATMGEIN